MDHVGLVDLQGSTVDFNDQMASAVNHLTTDNLTDCQPSSENRVQGTIIMPHGSVPVNEYNNALLWYMSYPWLFPYGRGGPEIERKTKLKGIRGYAKHLLQLADRKFSLDEAFKFHIFNVIQKRDVSYHTNLQIKRPGFDAKSIDSLDIGKSVRRYSIEKAYTG